MRRREALHLNDDRHTPSHSFYVSISTFDFSRPRSTIISFSFDFNVNWSMMMSHKFKPQFTGAYEFCDIILDIVQIDVSPEIVVEQGLFYH